MALASAKAILEIELDTADRNFGLLLSRKVAVTNAILTATARVTPGRLRGQEADHMDEIVATVKAQREKIAGLS